MPAFGLYPSANGTYQQWGVSSGTAWEAVKSSGGAYITLVGNLGISRSSFQMDNLPAAALAIVGGVVHNKRQAESADRSPGWSQCGFLSPSEQICGGHAVYKDGTYHAIPHTFATAYGGAAWTVAILNAAEIEVYDDPAVGWIRHDQLWASGNYTMPGSCFLPLLHVLLPLLGSCLGLRHMRGIAAEVWRRKEPGIGRSLIRPDEYGAALASLREYRRPRFVCL